MFLLCLIKFFIVRRERGGTSPTGGGAPLPLGVPPPTPPLPSGTQINYIKIALDKHFII